MLQLIRRVDEPWQGFRRRHHSHSDQNYLTHSINHITASQVAPMFKANVSTTTPQCL